MPTELYIPFDDSWFFDKATGQWVVRLPSRPKQMFTLISASRQYSTGTREEIVTEHINGETIEHTVEASVERVEEVPRGSIWATFSREDLTVVLAPGFDTDNLKGIWLALAGQIYA